MLTASQGSDDGHRSVFDVSWLRSNAYDRDGESFKWSEQSAWASKRLWDTATITKETPRVAYDRVVQSDSGLLDMLNNIVRLFELFCGHVDTDTVHRTRGAFALLMAFLLPTRRRRASWQSASHSSARRTLVRILCIFCVFFDTFDTQKGGFWDFAPNLEHADTAYTQLALNVHTDNTYFTDPAGYAFQSTKAFWLFLVYIFSAFAVTFCTF